MLASVRRGRYQSGDVSAIGSSRMSASPAAPRRNSRFWLYGPFVMLLALALGWSGFWFYGRGKVEAELAAAIAREAEKGRTWTCRDRSVGGYPFRIEVRCADLSLTSTRWGEAVTLSSGALVGVAQASAPRHLILQVAGPFVATLPEGRRIETVWKDFEASLRLTPGGFERLSLQVAEPVSTVTAPGQPTETIRSALFEAHLRPNPARYASEEAIDLAIVSRGAVLPALDALLGDSALSDLDVQATLSRAFAFRKGFNPDALESWRAAPGELSVTRLSLNKGRTRLEATALLGLDEAHRIAGKVDASVAGIDRIGGIRIGGGLSALGGLLGGRPQGGDQAGGGLTPLPPIVLRDGRAYIGPLRLPLQPFPPLY